ncbi:hypothetical protein [Nocardioides sp. AX2bis]|uniref:hypothetical protein n=1 Tax=Nocardioides sp. AX2bis TaxID=2653157 RepID=UPI0012F0AB8A|nr:hypothetical protein [Nocardioides sp. AX2bis]VXB04272.1 conserved hypothetical protein [Nocardioides sp. AX2bis]
MTTLLEVADRLYGLPLGDFTPTRDARARELRTEDRALSAAVKALRKPATAAWVVNQLVRGETEQVDQLLAVGDALREAQRSMSADELRALTRQRRQVTAAVTTRARAVARGLGVKVTGPVADQVEATLTAAMVDADCAAGVRSGLLVTPLASTGVGSTDVAAALAAPEALGFAASARETEGVEDEDAGADGRHGLHVVPDPDAHLKAVAAADEALAEAEEQLAAATEEETAAREEVAQLEARGLQLQSELEELRRRVAATETAAEEAEDELADAEEAAAEASRVTGTATADRDAAQAVRAALDEE